MAQYLKNDSGTVNSRDVVRLWHRLPFLSESLVQAVTLPIHNIYLAGKTSSKASSGYSHGV